MCFSQWSSRELLQDKCRERERGGAVEDDKNAMVMPLYPLHCYFSSIRIAGGGYIEEILEVVVSIA